LRNRCTLPQDETRVSQRYGCTMTRHRFSIKCRSGSKKNKFLASLMTTSVRKVSFTIGFGRLSGYTHVNQTYPDVVRMWRLFQGCPGSGVGIEWVFFSSGKQYDVLKKKNYGQDPAGKTHRRHQSSQSMFPTRDDKGVFTDNDDTCRKDK
jgi:hypothetical protein